MSREREPNIGVLIQNYNLLELIVMPTYYDITHGAASQISKKRYLLFYWFKFQYFLLLCAACIKKD